MAKKKESQREKVNVREEVVNRIVAFIESNGGKSPWANWEPGFDTTHSGYLGPKCPHNLFGRNRYRGINSVLLGMDNINPTAGYGTVNQVNKAGGVLLPGSRASEVVFMKPIVSKSAKESEKVSGEEHETEDEKVFWLMKFSRVFEVSMRTTAGLEKKFGLGDWVEDDNAKIAARYEKILNDAMGAGNESENQGFAEKVIRVFGYTGLTKNHPVSESESRVDYAQRLIKADSLIASGTEGKVDPGSRYKVYWLMARQELTIENYLAHLEKRNTPEFLSEEAKKEEVRVQAITDAVIDWGKRHGVDFRYDSAAKTAYFAHDISGGGNHHVVMPDRKQFKDAGVFLAVLAHEFGHATKVLGMEGRDTKGKEEEELVAELFSAKFMVSTGVPFSETRAACYVGGWSLKDTLMGDKNIIFRAAKKSDLAFDAMMSDPRLVDAIAQANAVRYGISAEQARSDLLGLAEEAQDQDQGEEAGQALDRASQAERTRAMTDPDLACVREVVAERVDRGAERKEKADPDSLENPDKPEGREEDAQALRDRFTAGF